MSEQRKWILGVVAAFLFGVAGGTVGALGAVAFMHQRHGPPHFAAGPRGFEDGAPGIRRERGERGGPGRRGPRRPPMERIVTQQLDLSAEQRTTIEGILDAARPRYAAVRDSTHAQIDRVLTPGQRAKLKEFETRFPGPSRDDRDRSDRRDAPDRP